MPTPCRDARNMLLQNCLRCEIQAENTLYIHRLVLTAAGRRTFFLFFAQPIDVECSEQQQSEINFHSQIRTFFTRNGRRPIKALKSVSRRYVYFLHSRLQRNVRTKRCKIEMYEQRAEGFMGKDVTFFTLTYENGGVHITIQLSGETLEHTHTLSTKH